MSEFNLNNGERQWRDRAGRPFPDPDTTSIQGLSSRVAAIGGRLYREHLDGGNFGNISVRDPKKEGFFITASGSYLDEPGLLVFVPLTGDVPKNASSEWRVHREIYKKTSHMTVVHAHPAHAVACSLISNEIIPQDSEGKTLCPVIPVVTGQPGSQDLADRVAECLNHGNLCVARAHGTFAAGKVLDEAYLYTSLAEYSSQIIMILQNLAKKNTVKQ